LLSSRPRSCYHSPHRVHQAMVIWRNSTIKAAAPSRSRLVAFRSRRPLSGFSIYYIILYKQLGGKSGHRASGPDDIFFTTRLARTSFGTLPVCKFQYYAIAFSPYPSPSSPDLCSKTYYITYSPYYVIVNIRMYYAKLKRFYFFWYINGAINNTWFGCSIDCAVVKLQNILKIYYKLKNLIRNKHKYNDLFYSGNSF